MLRKIFVITIILLIISTTFIKNHTKKLDEQIFSLKENINYLNGVKELVQLEHNYLSSPEKLLNHKKLYFEDDFTFTPRDKIIIVNNVDKINLTDLEKMNSENNFFNNENDFDKLSSKYNKNNLIISFNRVAFIFFIFILVLIIFSLKAFYLTGKNLPKNNNIEFKKEIRSNIVDRNNNILAKTILTRNIGINPNLVIDKQKLILNLKILFPEKNYTEINKKLDGKKFFYFAKELNPENYEKLIMLGDKSLIPENRVTRVYPQKNLFSHIIGQIDNENNGVSGIEKSFDIFLKNNNKDLKLTLDTDLQHLIRSELIKFQDIFETIGSAAILMNSNNGEILSLTSLPDFDLNKRQLLNDKNLINRATKGVYELGSVFKTFTYAAGLNEGHIEPNTEFKNLEKNIL